MKLKLLIFLMAIVVLSNCTIQKRTHCNGYYIDYNKKQKGEIKLPAVNKRENGNNLLATKKNDFKTPAAPSKVLSRRKSIDACGDTIRLIDGTKIICKVVEIGENEIEFKQCDNLNGKVYILKRELINKICFVNGTNELINIENEIINHDLEISNGKKECRDSLFFKNGKIVVCTILSSYQNSVQYKICDSSNASPYSIEREKLKREVKAKNILIKPKPQQYSIEREKLKREVKEKNILIKPKPQQSKDLKPQKKFHPFAITSFSASILCFIFMLVGIGNFTSGLFIAAVILAILTLIFGRIASSFIDANKEKYKGKGLVVFAAVIAIVSIVAFLLGAIFLSGMG